MARGVASDRYLRPPLRPARPVYPELRPPRDMPKRRNFGSLAGRTALLHALAHIELNAIDLAWDMVARFADAGLPREFLNDWVGVASEEAHHFSLLSARLADFGAKYGDLPAHDGLWEAAAATAGDLLARLAVVPLVLEARGLDVTPAMTEQLDRLGDAKSSAVLRLIYRAGDRPRRGRAALVRSCLPLPSPCPRANLSRPRKAIFCGRTETAVQPGSARRCRFPGLVL